MAQAPELLQLRRIGQLDIREDGDQPAVGGAELSV